MGLNRLLEKTTRLNVLYDFYGVLLTEKQKEYMELYYREDYSLGEISQLNDVSRQAIYDNIKRTEHILETYEEKLRLYEKHVNRQHVLRELKEKIDQSDIKSNLTDYVDRLMKID